MAEVGEASPRYNYILRANLLGHTATVEFLTFSPNEKLLASASQDGLVKIWDLKTQQIKHNLLGHRGSVNALAWMKDSTIVVSAGDDRTVKLWDVARGKVLNTLVGHKNFVNCCSFNPQGTLIASGSDDQSIYIWDRRTGCPITIISQQEECIKSLVFNEDGSLIVSGDWEGHCCIWETASAKCVTVIEASFLPVTDVKILPDEKWLMTTVMGGCVKLWDASNLSSKTLIGHLNNNYSLAADCFKNPDGTIKIICGSEDRLLYIWDLESGLVEHKLIGHTSEVLRCACHPSAHLIASSALLQDSDNVFAIKLWEGTKS